MQAHEEQPTWFRMYVVSGGELSLMRRSSTCTPCLRSGEAGGEESLHECMLWTHLCVVNSALIAALAGCSSEPTTQGSAARPAAAGFTPPHSLAHAQVVQHGGRGQRGQQLGKGGHGHWLPCAPAAAAAADGRPGKVLGRQRILKGQFGAPR